jgi:SAM-dependent methyltransferase
LTVTLDERLRYHPDPNPRNSTRSKRRVDGRCRIIEEQVELSGKRLLDLGCSGGYFGFKWARVVARYLGVDADNAVIERNHEVARQRSLTNVEFHRATITPSLIRSLPPVDIALFLSVFHHILATSAAYEWNGPPDFDPFDLLRALQERVDVLAFETGYPDEGFEWCERLPPMTPTPRAWIERVLRDAGFRYVEVIPASTYQGAMDGVRRRIARRLGYARHPRPLSGRIASHVLQVDPRDNRDLFFASNRPLRTVT